MQTNQYNFIAFSAQEKEQSQSQKIDSTLVNLRKSNLPWFKIAAALNEKFSTNYSGPQVSQRYRRVISKGSNLWTSDDIKRLRELGRQLPRKWAEIGRILKKSDSQVQYMHRRMQLQNQ